MTTFGHHLQQNISCLVWNAVPANITNDSPVDSFKHLLNTRMDGWLGFNSILSMQVADISCLRKFKFVSKANCVYKRDYAFRMNVMEEIFEITSCIEILANDIKVNTADEYMLYI